MSWRDQAACKGMNPNLFYEPKHAAQALITCWSCPVQQQCGQHADDTAEEYGVWGASLRRLRQEHPERVRARAVIERELRGTRNWVYSRELSLRCGLQTNTVQKTLARMVDSGCVEVRRAGKRLNQWRWKSDCSPSCPHGVGAGLHDTRSTAGVS